MFYWIKKTQNKNIFCIYFILIFIMDDEQEGGLNFGIYDKLRGQPTDGGLIPNMGMMDRINQMRANTPVAEPAAQAPEPIPQEAQVPVSSEPIPQEVQVPVSSEPIPQEVQAPPRPSAPEMHPEVAAYAAAKQAEIDANNLKSQGKALIDQGTQVVQDAQAQQQGLVAQGAQIVQDAQTKQQELTAQGNELIAKGNNDLNAAISAMGGLAPAAPVLAHGTAVRNVFDATANGLGNAGEALSGAVGAFNNKIGNWFGSLTPAQQAAAAKMTPEQQASAAQKGGFFNDHAKVKGGTRKQKAKKGRKSKKVKKSKKRGSKKNKSNK